MKARKSRTNPCPLCGYQNLSSELYCVACKANLIQAEREARNKNRQTKSERYPTGSFILLLAGSYIVFLGPILAAIFLAHIFAPTLAPFISLFWLLSCITASHRTPGTESVSIIHSLIALYVTFALFIGRWEVIGQWERLGLASVHHGTLIWGWVAWALSLIPGIFVIRDFYYRFDSYAVTSYFARHRQLGYTIGYFGILLIAYSAGAWKIPFFITSAFLGLALSLNTDQQPGNRNE
ncbi:MAG: hypothetical protein ACKN9W_12475 [Methylococcus sp.]